MGLVAVAMQVVVVSGLRLPSQPWAEFRRLKNPYLE